MGHGDVTRPWFVFIKSRAALDRSNENSDPVLCTQLYSILSQFRPRVWSSVWKSVINLTFILFFSNSVSSCSFFCSIWSDVLLCHAIGKLYYSSTPIRYNIYLFLSRYQPTYLKQSLVHVARCTFFCSCILLLFFAIDWGVCTGVQCM